ncbi:hypothetical protein LguiB_001921 [Lonicera macranthoides]
MIETGHWECKGHGGDGEGRGLWSGTVGVWEWEWDDGVNSEWNELSRGLVDCASNGNVSLIEDDDVPIPPWTFLIPDQDGDPMTINIPSDVNMNNMQIPEHVRFVNVEKVSTLLRMIVGLQHILVSKMLESRDRLNASNVVIHELRRRIQEYEGNQNRNGDEEDGLVTSEVVHGAGGGC